MIFSLNLCYVMQHANFKLFHHPYHMYYMKNFRFKYHEMYKSPRWLKPVYQI